MIRRDDTSDESDDRRSHPRLPARLLPTLSAQLSGGSKVTLLDLSQHGVRLETTRHMRPGQMVSLRFSIDDQIVTINASVVRASIVRVGAEEVRYETGLRLSDEFSCDQLQVALVEQQGTNESSVPEDVACPEPFVFAAVENAAGHVDSSRGWWLSGNRTERPASLEGR
ncbi:PilZ domain protein [Luteitalea pratensis]|uniref:PilZ domain protein n=1 Tax=Luteitalea pratensis TaxID=1855912 RepID=A0A143PGK4_LUTPR|nr:PilZ domain-containing protein [Luteitalea pratensis]AMY07383.1 PilZ domain protein [Luteitalea pratensis]